MLAKNSHDKYRKNRKNNKCNKIRDLGKEEAKKGPEMSPNIGKITLMTGQMSYGEGLLALPYDKEIKDLIFFYTCTASTTILM